MTDIKKAYDEMRKAADAFASGDADGDLLHSAVVDYTDAVATGDASRLLSLNRAGLLADLIRAVERKSSTKLRYYQFGTETDKPAEYVLRAFTHEGGGFLRYDEDVRDAFVWCSGIFEHWFPVEELLDALDNITTGLHGWDKPMAAIDYQE